ncbi:unnamed protein product, partial [Polarella glacialis]
MWPEIAAAVNSMADAVLPAVLPRATDEADTFVNGQALMMLRPLALVPGADFAGGAFDAARGRFLRATSASWWEAGDAHSDQDGFT